MIFLKSIKKLNKRGKNMKDIIDVKQLDDYKLLLVFKDNEKRIKDMRLNEQKNRDFILEISV